MARERTEVEELRAAVRRLFPLEVAVAALGTDAAGCMVAPSEIERRICTGFAEGRRTEFLTGRVCARVCLEALGFHPPDAIGIGAGRQPLWPEGAIGSIAHSGGCAVAVAAKVAGARSIGVDLERPERMKRNLWRLILSDSEQRGLEKLETAWNREGDETGATILFSAKETFYKWQYPLTGLWLGFHDVQTEILPEEACVRLEVIAAGAPDILRGTTCRIGFARLGDWVLTGLFR